MRTGSAACGWLNDSELMLANDITCTPVERTFPVVYNSVACQVAGITLKCC